MSVANDPVRTESSIAHSAVKTHSLHIFEKVSVANQVELLNAALALIPTLKL